VSEERERAEQEDSGEAGLGEAQAENPAPDEEMVEGEAGDPAGAARGPADDPAAVPAPVPSPEERSADEQAELAARDAARIGGEVNVAEDMPEADRGVIEGGGGEAEGFELAEQQLQESASHGDAAGHPLADRMPPEEENPAEHTAYGEADDAVHRETVESQDPGKEGQS
jgi:hypothetical protein